MNEPAAEKESGAAVGGCRGVGTCFTVISELLTIPTFGITLCSGVASYGALGHVPPTRLVTVSFLVHFGVTEESQLSKYCVVCEIS